MALLQVLWVAGNTSSYFGFPQSPRSSSMSGSNYFHFENMFICHFCSVNRSSLNLGPGPYFLLTSKQLVAKSINLSTFAKGEQSLSPAAFQALTWWCTFVLQQHRRSCAIKLQLYTQLLQQPLPQYYHLLFLCLGPQLAGLGEPCGVLGLEACTAMCQASTLLAVLESLPKTSVFKILILILFTSIDLWSSGVGAQRLKTSDRNRPLPPGLSGKQWVWHLLLQPKSIVTLLKSYSFKNKNTLKLM